MKRDKRQKPLEYHKGCKGCTRECIFNRPCVSFEKYQQESDKKYGCNSSLKPVPVFKK